MIWALARDQCNAFLVLPSLLKKNSYAFSQLRTFSISEHIRSGINDGVHTIVTSVMCKLNYENGIRNLFSSDPQLLETISFSFLVCQKVHLESCDVILPARLISLETHALLGFAALGFFCC